MNKSVTLNKRHQSLTSKRKPFCLDRLIRFAQKLTFAEQDKTAGTRRSNEILNNVIESKSKSMMHLSRIDTGMPMGKTCITADEIHLARSEKALKNVGSPKPLTRLTDEGVKLVPPYGDWCAYSGGGGSGGCVITGPYEASIFAYISDSDQSFESTDETDMNQLEPPINDENQIFHDYEVVWAKQIGHPWFPAVILSPYDTSKEAKDLIKFFNPRTPSKRRVEEISNVETINSNEYNVLVINRKYQCWQKLPGQKIRKFGKESEQFYIESLNLLGTKHRKRLEKAYKKAKKLTKR